jgi:hypothetical protein
MDPQLIAVIALVGLAVAYLLRRSIRVWAGAKKGGCGGGCGCSRAVENAKENLEVVIPRDELRVRNK